MARFAQLGEAFRNAARLKGNHVRFIDSTCAGVCGAQHVNATRASQKRMLHLRLNTRRGKRHERFAEYLALLKNAIDEAQNVGMAAEVVGQHDGHARVVFAHVLHMAVVHRNVGAAEAVDALLGIAHRAQTLAAHARHGAHHIDLQLVGVLEFVDHNEFEFVGKRLANVLVFLQCSRSQNEQVIVVERRHLTFLRVIRCIDLAGQTNKVAQQRLRESEAGLLAKLRRLALHLFREGLVFFRAEISGGERARIGKPQKRFARNLARSEQRIGLLEEFVGFLEERVGRFLPGGRCRGVPRGRRKLKQLACDYASRARLRRKAHAFHAARARNCRAGDFANHVFNGRLGEAAMRARGVFRKQRIETARRPEFVLPRKHFFHRGVEQVGGRRLIEHRKRGVNVQLRGMHAQDARAHAMDG